MSKPAILITGAEGQVGRALQQMQGSYPEFECTFAGKNKLDITDLQAIDLLFSRSPFQYCINAAAYTQVDKAEEDNEKAFAVNAEAAENLAKACKKYHCPIIHISSDYVYHPDHNNVIHEGEECHPKSVYARSKRKGEENILKVLSEHIIIRTSWVYAALGHNFLNTMLRLGKNNHELNIVSDQTGSPTCAKDLAEVIFEIIKKLENSDSKSNFWGIYNFSNAGFTNWAEFAEEIFLNTDYQVKIHKIPTEAYPTLATRPKNSRLSKSKITEQFGINLKNWRGSLAKCIEEIHN